MLKVWNLSLIIIAFSLTIFGTFLTRSGILSSIHAFSSGPVGSGFSRLSRRSFCFAPSACSPTAPIFSRGSRSSTPWSAASRLSC